MKALFSKLTSFISDSKETIQEKGEEAKVKLQNELTSKVNNVFDDVLNEPMPDEDLEALLDKGREGSDRLITKAANTNALISGGCALVPGPYGLLAVVPEIYLVTKNQMNLIRDLGIVYGHKGKLNRELLMYLFATSMGIGTIGLVAIHGGKTLVKRASLRVMQKIVVVMGGKITQKALASQIATWLPFVGAAAMAAWTRYSTQKVGETCCALLEKDILLSDEEIDEIEIQDDENEFSNEKVNIESLKVLVNLAKIDGLSSIEIEFIKAKIDVVVKSPEVKNEFLLKLLSNDSFEIDYGVFSNELDKALLIENLNSLASEDELVTPEEKMFIEKVKSSI